MVTKEIKYNSKKEQFVMSDKLLKLSSAREG